MTDRSILLRLRADISDLKAKLGDAGSAVDKLGARTKATAQQSKRSFDDLSKSISQHKGDIDTIGSSMLKFGTVGAVALGGVGKASIDWQSAWAGVTKTVDFSNQAFGSAADQSAKLEGQLRNMAKSMPATHSQIAAVAEAAGQLGVKTPDIASFTKVMIDLGETTNLSSDEAATSLAQLMNIMGTAGKDVDRLGATIVGLGNSGASTERDIVQMGLRIAGAGKQVGLSETQVLAFANALASVGIDAEAGGTAISTSFLKIEQAVRSGGKELELLAETAGMSLGDFRAAFEQDAAGAMNSFIAGLGKVQVEGGNTTGILKQLGITGIRESDALRRLASSGDLLTESLRTGSDAWRDNNALVEEAAKRYNTAESQAKIAWNQIKDSAISAGQSLLPMLAQAATSVGQLAEWFGDLPEPVQKAGIAVGVTVTALGLLGGGALKAITGLADLRTAFRTMGLAADGAGRAMKIATLSIPVVGIALLGVTTAIQHFTGKAATAKQSATEFSGAMGGMEGTVNAATAALDKNVRAVAAGQLQQQGAFADADKLGISYDVLTDAALGNAKAIRIKEAAQREGLAKGREYGKAAIHLGEVLDGVSDAASKAAEEHNQLKTATEGSSEAADGAASAQDELASATADLDKQTSLLNIETQKMIDKFTILREGALSVQSANINWEKSIDDVRESTKGKKKTLDTDTKAGRENRSAIIDATRALNDKITADFKATKETKGLKAATVEASKSLKTGRERLLDSAEAAGLNRSAVGKMIDKMLKTPKELETDINTPGIKEAQKNVDALGHKINGLESKTISVTADFRVTADKAVAELNKKLVSSGGKNAMKISLYSGGGHVHGPGTDTSDDIPAMLSNNEFVIKASSSKKLGKARLDYINEHGELPGFRTGGLVHRDLLINGRTNGAPDVSGLYDAPAAALGDSAKRYMDQMSKAFVSALQSTQDQASGNFGKIDVSAPRAHTTFRGHVFSNLMAASLLAAEKDAGSTLQIYQGGFRPRTSYSGTSHQGDAIDAKVDFALIKALRKHGVPTWDRTGKGNWVSHMHGIPLPGAGFPAGSAVWQGQDYLRGGDGLYAGGPVEGPGTSTSDSINKWLSKGEYVVNARATEANRPWLDAMNFQGATVPRNLLPGSGQQQQPLIDTAALRSALSSLQFGLKGDLTMVNGRAYVEGIASVVADNRIAADHRAQEVAY